MKKGLLTQTPCPRCCGQRVIAEVDTHIQRLGGKPLVGFSVVVCTSCGFSELYVNPRGNGKVTGCYSEVS